MTLKTETHTMKETSTFKCILKLHKNLMIALLCCVCYDEKQRQYFSDYYKNITNVKNVK